MTKRGEFKIHRRGTSADIFEATSDIPGGPHKAARVAITAWAQLQETQTDHEGIYFIIARRMNWRPAARTERPSWQDFLTSEHDSCVKFVTCRSAKTGTRFHDIESVEGGHRTFPNNRARDILWNHEITD